MQITMPKIIYDYSWLVKNDIERDISFSFSYRGINQHIDKKYYSGLDPRELHAVTLKLIAMEPGLIQWELIPAKACENWKHIWSFDSDFLENIDADFHTTCMRIKEKRKRQSGFDCLLLHKILLFPDERLRAIIGAMSGLTLSNIEKYFMLGGNVLHARLLESSYEKYWGTTNGERVMADIRIDKTISQMLSLKESPIFKNGDVRSGGSLGLSVGLSTEKKLDMTQYMNLFPEDKSAECKINESTDGNDDKFLFIEKESMAQKLRFFLRAPIKARLDFIHQAMSQDYIYIDPGVVFFKPFVANSCEYVRRNIYPISGDSKQEAMKIFESFVRSLQYKESSIKRDVFSVADLEIDKNFKKMCDYCKELLKKNPEVILFKELIDKGCDPKRATEILYYHKRNNRKPKISKKPDKKNNNFKASSLRSAQSRLQKKVEKMSDNDKTDIIEMLRQS